MKWMEDEKGKEWRRGKRNIKWKMKGEGDGKEEKWTKSKMK